MATARQKGLSRFSFRAWSILTALLLVVILLLPIAYAFWNSLWDESGFTLRAYSRVLTEARQWALLRNSLAIAVGAAFFATLLGVGVAFALEYLRVPFRRLMAYGVALPFLIPAYISAVAWMDVLGTNGILHGLLKKIETVSGPQSATGLALFSWVLDVATARVNTAAGAVFVSSLSYYPIVALTTALALRRFDRRLVEAARLAASRTQALRSVVLPLLAPSIVTGALIVFLLTLVGFAVPSLLQVNVYPIEIFTSFSAFYDFPSATAQALPLIACGVAAVVLGALYIGPRRAWLTGAVRVRVSIRGGAALRLLAALACWALILVSGVLPIAVLVWRSLPLRSYSEAVATAKEEIVTSLFVATAAATVITALAFSIAYLQRRKWGLSQGSMARWDWSHFLRLASLLSLAPFLASGPVIGIALIATWNRPGIPALVYDSILVVVFACVARFLFFAQRAFDAALSDVHASLEEAAFVSGVPWWRQVGCILLPLMWPVVIGIWGLSFVLCMGELDATALVCPPGVTTLPVRIFSLMHYGPSRLVAALSVITVIVILACAGVTAAVYAKGKRMRHAGR